MWRRKRRERVKEGLFRPCFFFEERVQPPEAGGGFGKIQGYPDRCTRDCIGRRQQKALNLEKTFDLLGKDGNRKTFFDNHRLVSFVTLDELPCTTDASGHPGTGARRRPSSSSGAASLLRNSGGGGDDRRRL